MRSAQADRIVVLSGPAGKSHDGTRLARGNAEWSYPDPHPASSAGVGKDDSGYAAFDKQQVTVAG
jgi:hypothetical protein